MRGARRCGAARGGGPAFPQHPVHGAGQHPHGRWRRGAPRRARVRGQPGRPWKNPAGGPFWVRPLGARLGHTDGPIGTGSGRNGDRSGVGTYLKVYLKVHLKAYPNVSGPTERCTPSSALGAMPYTAPPGWTLPVLSQGRLVPACSGAADRRSGVRRRRRRSRCCAPLRRAGRSLCCRGGNPLIFLRAQGFCGP